MRAATAQCPGPERSQDRVWVTNGAAIVLDGASAFIPVNVHTGAYVDKLGRGIVDAILRNPTHDLADLVAESISGTGDELGLQPGASPSSTVSIVRARGDVVDLYTLGDGAIFYGDSEVTHELIDSRITELGISEHREYRERLAQGYGYDDTHRELLTKLQQQQQRQRNQPSGYWIAEADPQAAQHAFVRTVHVNEIAWAVLATDGAYNSMVHLGLDNWPAIARLDTTDLRKVLKQCTVWETEVDPIGQQRPRSKVADDKTLAAIALTAL